MITLFGKPEPSLLERLKESVGKTKDALADTLDTITQGGRQIDPSVLKEVETALLSADLGVKTTREILDSVREQMSRNALSNGDQLKREIKAHVFRALNVYGASPKLADAANGSDPRVIFVVGVNGAGKTTSIGKLANRLRQDGRSVVLCAADTFRAAAVEQLHVWAERTGAQFSAQQTGADPGAVVFDALQSAQARHIDVVLADTAGRLHSQTHLMDELKKVKRVIARLDPEAPQEVLLVLDANQGQNALAQAQQFHAALGVTGLVLTKLDGSARGGILVAIARALQLPIRFIGVGEKAEDFGPFDAQAFASALIDGEGT